MIPSPTSSQTNEAWPEYFLWLNRRRQDTSVSGQISIVHWPPDELPEPIRHNRRSLRAKRSPHRKILPPVPLPVTREAHPVLPPVARPDGPIHMPHVAATLRTKRVRPGREAYLERQQAS